MKMKQMLTREKCLKVPGIYVMKLKDGRVLQCESIRDVPETIRHAGACWPEDVIRKNVQQQNRQSL